MSQQKINIAQVAFSEDEVDAALEVLRSGAVRQGPQCEEFEKEFARKTGAAHAVTCANGTAALHMAYMASIQPGDEVIVPSFTFIATASMVVMAGGRPVFCDVDPETFLIDLEDAQKRISAKTKAIAPVHLFGAPVDMDGVGKLASSHGLKVVWDAAQAHGATHNGADVGAAEGISCYSFYPTKNMAVGEGGMMTTQDEAAAEKLRALRAHGETGKYLHTSVGFNYRMTDVEAAIGRRQLEKLDANLEKRTQNAMGLAEGLKDIPGLSVQKVDGKAKSAWNQFCVLVDKEKAGMDRDTLAARLAEAGIGTGVHYPRGLHQQPAFSQIAGEALPVTEMIAERILALPVHPLVTAEDVGRITGAIRTLIKAG